MRIGKMSGKEIRDLVGTALDAGIEMTDHADIYGGTRHHSEARCGEAIQLAQADRERMVIQTKAGIRKEFFDFSVEHILRSVEGSARSLDKVLTVAECCPSGDGGLPLGPREVVSPGEPARTRKD